jgi:tripartite-type tricarboxylate transporter receptor subunit TctC
MKIPRRKFLHLVASTAVLPAVLRVATAQTYPSRPITVVVPFAAGGNNDVNARVLAERMRGPLGQPVIIENVSGADGSIGTARAGSIRAYAVASDTRSALAPDIPTSGEMGLPLSFSGFGWLFAFPELNSSLKTEAPS